MGPPNPILIIKAPTLGPWGSFAVPGPRYTLDGKYASIHKELIISIEPQRIRNLQASKLHKP